MADNLPITKDQFDEAIMPFVNKFKRLPYLDCDEVEISIEVDRIDENEEVVVFDEMRPYKSSRYITAFYGNQDKMTEQLMKDKVVTYKLVADITGHTETVIANAMKQETKNPEKLVRRAIHMFFNKDYYKKELGEYTKRCDDCKNKCKQFYFVQEVKCGKYKAKK